MWSSLEKAAKKAAREANAAAKIVTENQQFQSVAGKVKAKTEKVTTKVQKMVDHTNRYTAAGKSSSSIQSSQPLPDEKNHSPKTNSPKSSKRFGRVEVDASGKGDCSEITWADGSISSLPSLRVFGKDTRIVVPEDSKKNKNNNDTEETTGVDETATAEIDPVHRSTNREDVKGDEAPASNTTPKVNLPVLIFPGMASSGLHVEESGLDNAKYQGKRLWMNAGFLAASAMGNSVVDTSTVNPINIDPYINESESERTGLFGNVEHLDRETTTTATAANSHVRFSQDSAMSIDANSAVEFAKTEEELKIRSAWLYHIALDKNMVDERHGNRVRTYDGIKACEWLVDENDVGKNAAVVWADMIHFLEKKLGYVRGENLDAAPYDWRLPPSCTEARDGYLTRTMETVERLYNESGGLPVVMCCHSMGCKMGHYFLNFCLREKGREWIDQHIHTYMPVGAPHCGAPLTLKLGATGSGLLGLLDDMMISLDEGLIMYRSWGSGPWLVPRDLPPGVFPPCIVRREGELGLKITSQIDVYSLFADRDKPPKELRLTIIFREKIHVTTDYVPLQINSETNPTSMILSFDETFYLAVPYLEDEDGDMGSLIFYLEEPSGRLYRDHQTRMRTQFQNATSWARGFKKEFTKIYRSVAKKMGAALRVAVCEKPVELKVSAFTKTASTTMDGTPVIELSVPFCKCNGGIDARKILDESESHEGGEEENEALVAAEGAQRTLVPAIEGGDSTVGLLIHIRYTPPPDVSVGASNCTTRFGMIHEDTPMPPVVSTKRRSNTIRHDKIAYDAWHGRDLFDKDGFMGGMFDVTEEYYEQDPLGPTTKSALEAPPVNRVRAIYGINVPTEVSVVYRKESVVTIGDSKADRRFKIDKSAAFPTHNKTEGSTTSLVESQARGFDSKAEAMLEGYTLKDGIIEETPECFQHVPGTSEQRRCCGDGTVPYWSLVHCLTWKDSIPDVTADELEGAVHRPILSDQRFHALLQQYCTVEDPRLPPSAEITTVERNFSGLGLATIPDASSLRSYV